MHGSHTKWHREGCCTSCNLPAATAATGIKGICLCRGGREALPSILQAKLYLQEPVKRPGKGTACRSWNQQPLRHCSCPSQGSRNRVPALAPHSKPGSWMQKVSPPQSSCLPGTLQHTHVALSAAGDTPGLAQSGRGTAGHGHRDCLRHRSPGTDEGRRPCPEAALLLHSQDRLRHPLGRRAQASYRAGKQVCSGKQPQRRIFSLALLGEVCCLRCQVPSLPPGIALAPNPTGRCTEHGLQPHSVTWSNFILFSSACRETGQHKPPALQPLPSLEARPIRGPALLSSVVSPCRFIPVETLFYANKSPRCPQAAASSNPPPSPGLLRALQPVYPDFNRQLQLLQYRRVSRNSRQQALRR